MKFKNLLFIIIKVVIVVTMISYLPNHSNNLEAVVLNASNNTSALQASQSIVTKDKRIHIYNTHQGEEYVGFNVVLGANYLKDCLSSMGYYCDVEGNDFEGYKAVHNIAYKNSYSVSKMYLQQNLDSNGNYDLIIDFHRDSISKQLSTIEYNGVSYAKVMFVVGQSSGKYEAVNQLSSTLSDLINGIVPNLSRGVYVKKSHYNQGISDNMILIEVGAQSNSEGEVKATVDVLAKAIGGYLQ